MKDHGFKGYKESQTWSENPLSLMETIIAMVKEMMDKNESQSSNQKLTIDEILDRNETKMNGLSHFVIKN